MHTDNYINDRRAYTPDELEALADKLIADDAHRTFCPTCGSLEEDSRDIEPVCPNGCDTWERRRNNEKGFMTDEAYVLTNITQKRRRAREVPMSSFANDDTLFDAAQLERDRYRQSVEARNWRGMETS